MGRELVMPEQNSTILLSEQEQKIFELILEYWPICALDVAEHFRVDLSSRAAKRKASTKYSYYLQKLIDKRIVLGKKVGNGVVVWPLVVEKYRTIHNILRE